MKHGVVNEYGGHAVIFHLNLSHRHQVLLRNYQLAAFVHINVT